MSSSWNRAAPTGRRPSRMLKLCNILNKEDWLTSIRCHCTLIVLEAEKLGSIRIFWGTSTFMEPQTQCSCGPVDLFLVSFRKGSRIVELGSCWASKPNSDYILMFNRSQFEYGDLFVPSNKQDSSSDESD